MSFQSLLQDHKDDLAEGIWAKKSQKLLYCYGRSDGLICYINSFEALHKWKSKYKPTYLLCILRKKQKLTYSSIAHTRKVLLVIAESLD